MRALINKYMRSIWRVLVLIFYWREPPRESLQSALPPEPQPEPAPEPVPEPAHLANLLAAGLVPPPDIALPMPVLASPGPLPELPLEPPPVPPAPPLEAFYPYRRAKWVKPQGAQPVLRPRLEPQEPRPVREPREPKPKPQPATDDPEQWGQYYFRDVILDQLDTYWVYLKRMRRGDEDSFKLLRQVGIQLMPYSTTRGFDKWRDEERPPELSPWWHTNRPAFGAVAYGFDDVTKETESFVVTDMADPDYEAKHPEYVDRRKKHLDKAVDGGRHRPLAIVRTPIKYDKKQFDRPVTMWHPRFLYFQKYAKTPSHFERIDGGDTYELTVYWDRWDKHTPKYMRGKRAGGVPQAYGVWVEHGTGKVRVLKTKLHTKIKLRWCRGPRGGRADDLTLTQTEWTVPDQYLRWSHRGRDEYHHEPEEYLRRLFIEAAALYESSVLGSMIRVAVSKGPLTATFGVEVKRMSYFFKDRDVVLNVNGVKKRIFHIVRAHVRKDGAEVPFHFRGLRQFKWAKYDVNITVPGRDHIALPDFNVGAEKGLRGPNVIGQEKLGRKLNDWIREGKGAMK